jgi:hypothetical protein
VMCAGPASSPTLLGPLPSRQRRSKRDGSATAPASAIMVVGFIAYGLISTGYRTAASRDFARIWGYDPNAERFLRAENRRPRSRT